MSNAKTPNVARSKSQSFESLFEVIGFTTALQADLGRALQELWEGTDRSGRSLYIIGLIHSGIDRPSQLAEYFDVLPSTISFELNKLVSDGLLVRERVPGDGRSLRLSLTDAGTALHHSMYTIINAFMQERAANLEPGELETFLSIGRKLTSPAQRRDISSK